MVATVGDRNVSVAAVAMLEFDAAPAHISERRQSVETRCLPGAI
jgi:hypothetical protein